MPNSLKQIEQDARISTAPTETKLVPLEVEYDRGQQNYILAQAAGMYPELRGLKADAKGLNPKEILFDPTGGVASENKMARDMSGLNLLVNSIGKGVVEFENGFIDTVGAFVELPEILTGLTDGSNFFMDLAEENRLRGEKIYPIHVKNPSATFAFDDPGWWANGGVSAIASSLALMVPAGLISKATKFVGGLFIQAAGRKAATSVAARVVANRATAFGIDVATGKAVRGALAPLVAESAYMAGIMRNTENIMEGYQVNKTFKNENFDAFLNPDSEKYLSDTDIEEIKTRNKLDTNLNREEVLNLLAAKATTESYRVNSVNFVFDFAQTFMLLKGFQGFSRATTASRAKQALEMNPAAKGWGTFGYNTWGYRAGTAAHTVATQGISEGFEEIINYIGTEEGLSYGKQLVTGKERPGFGYRLGEYLSNPHAWESAFWGAIGGSFTPGFMKAGNRIVQQFNKFAYNTPTTTDRKVDEITSRKIRLATFQGITKQIEEGIDPTTNKKIEGTEEEIAETKTYLKKRYLKSLGQQMARDAVDVGNEKWLKSYFSSEEVFTVLEKSVGITKEDFKELENSVDKNIERYTSIKNTLSQSTKLFDPTKYNINPNLVDVAAQRILESEHSQEVLETERALSQNRYEEEKEKDTYRKTLTPEEAILYDNHIEFMANEAAIKNLENAKKTNDEGMVSVPFIESLDKKIIELETRNKEIKAERGTYHWSMGRATAKHLAYSRVYEGTRDAEKASNKFRFDNNTEILQEYQAQSTKAVEEYNKEQLKIINNDLDSITVDTENFEVIINDLEAGFLAANPTLKGKVNFKDKINKLKAEKLKADNKATATAGTNPTTSDTNTTTNTTNDTSVNDVTLDEVKEVFGSTTEDLDALNAAIKAIEETDDSNLPTSVEVDGDPKTSYANILDDGNAVIHKYINQLERTKTPTDKTVKILKYLRDLQLKLNPILDNIAIDENPASLNIFLTSLMDINNTRDLFGNIIIDSEEKQKALALHFLTQQHKKGDKLTIHIADKREDFLSDKSYNEYLQKAKDSNDVILVIRGTGNVILGHTNQRIYLENELKLVFDLLHLNDTELANLEKLFVEYNTSKTDAAKQDILDSEEFKKLTLDNTNDIDKHIYHITQLLLFKKDKRTSYQVDASITRTNLDNWNTKIERDLKNSEELKSKIKPNQRYEIEISHLTSGMLALANVGGRYIKNNLNDVRIGESAEVEIALTQKGSSNSILIPLNPKVKIAQDFSKVYEQTFYMLIESKGKHIPTPLYRSYIGQKSDANVYYKYLSDNIKTILENLNTKNDLKDAEVKSKFKELQSIVALPFNAFNQRPATGNRLPRLEFNVNINRVPHKYQIVLTDTGLQVSVNNGPFLASESALKDALSHLSRHVDFALLKENKPFYDPVSKKKYNSYKEFVIETGAFRTAIAQVNFGKKLSIGHFVANQQGNADGSSLILNLDSTTLKEQGDTNAPAARRENIVSPSGSNTNQTQETDLPNVQEILKNSEYSFMEKEYIASELVLHPKIGIPEAGRESALAHVKGNVLTILPAFNNLTKDEKAQILAHETIHGVLSNLRKTNPKIADELDAKLAIYYKNLRVFMKANNVQTTPLIDKILLEVDKNVEEIVTYAFTAPSFAKFLNDMVISDTAKPEFKKSFLTQLKELFIDILEKLGYTQLDKLHQILDEHIFTETFATENEIANTMSNEDVNNLTNTDLAEEDDDPNLFAEIVDYPSNIRNFKQSLRQRFRDALIARNLINKYNEFEIGLDQQGKSALSRIYDVAYEYERDAKSKGFNVTAEDMFTFGEDINLNSTKGRISINNDLYNIRYASVVDQIQNDGRKLRKKCL